VKIIVDTNIVCSAILKPQGHFEDILLNSGGIFHFLAPSLLLEELEKYRTQLLQLSGYPEDELEFVIRSITKTIDFIDLENLHADNIAKSIELTGNVDPKDAPIIALSLASQAVLWTGDKKLITGLRSKGFTQVCDTVEIQKVRSK
jgi:predicted nucleic acid-binding protein